MKSIRFLIILLFICSCQSGDDYSGVYNITGKTEYDNGQNAGYSQIFLNNELKTTADHDGDFAIMDVNAGTYNLKAIHSDSSGYAEVEVDVDLKGSDLDLESLLLPVPIKLLEASDVRSNSIKLTWNRCNASDFREYKIYIHHSSALDENTGTLLSIVTEINDTVLTVGEGDFWWGGSTLAPNTTYYFRVFVMNSYGRLSGSNIMEVTTSLWDNAGDFTNNYTLQLQSSFAAQGDLTGIAWDGEYFWMLYFKEQGGFNDNNKLSLVKYDHTQAITLDTVIFDDSNYFSNGITWDGTNVWLSLETYIQLVNIENKNLGKSLFAGDFTVDLAWDGENLILLDLWNKVMIINPLNGSIIHQFATPFSNIGYSGEKGVASRENEIWIINNWHREIAIVDHTGKHIGVAGVDFLQEGLTASDHRIPMCFMDEKLVIAFDSQVRIYTIEHEE